MRYSAAPLFAGITFALLGASAAMAGGCGYSETTPGPNSSTVLFDELIVQLSGGPGTTTSLSCSFSATAAIPAGTVGVYKIDTRGIVFLQNGKDATYMLSGGSTTDAKAYTGPFDQSFTYTTYHASGPSASFDGTIDLSISGSSDPDSQLVIDTLDVLAGFTTIGSVQASIDQLATGRSAILRRVDTSSRLLTGGNQPLIAPDNLSAIGALGSDVFGVAGHFNLGSGFSLDGGGALLNQATTKSGVTGPLLSGAIRYVQPGAEPIRPFGQAAFSLAPNLGMNFSRHYTDGMPSGATVTSSTSGSLFNAGVEAGVLFAPNLSNQIAFSGSLTHTALSVAGYSETLGETNLFAANVGSSTGSYDTVELGVAWTTAIAPTLDVTLSAGLGKTFSHDPVTANVAFVGTFTSAAQDEVFASYGARLGWKFAPNMTADAFVLGSSGQISGTDIKLGAALHMQF
jgi:hypothetical protein